MYMCNMEISARYIPLTAPGLSTHSGWCKSLTRTDPSGRKVRVGPILPQLLHRFCGYPPATKVSVLHVRTICPPARSRNVKAPIRLTPHQPPAKSAPTATGANKCQDAARCGHRNGRVRLRARARSREERRGRTRCLRDTIEEEAVRILEGNHAATLQRIHNITRRKIEPVTPAGCGVWIEIDADGRIQVGFR